MIYLIISLCVTADMQVLNSTYATESLENCKMEKKTFLESSYLKKRCAKRFEIKCFELPGKEIDGDKK